jgi:hypothetical protein
MGVGDYRRPPHHRRCGVYLADGFVGEECGGKDEQVLAITVPEGVELDPYLIEDRGLGFREGRCPRSWSTGGRRSVLRSRSR